MEKPILIIGVFFLFAFYCLAKVVFKPSAETRGARGETKTAKYLGLLPPSEYFIYNDILLRFNNYTTQIDHVVVSRYGVFVIETKNLHGKIYGSENKEYWSQYLPQHFRKYFGDQEFKVRNPIWQNAGHIRSLQRIITDNSVPFYGIVAFPPMADLKVSSNSPVLTWREIPPYILSHNDAVLSEEAVSLIKEQLEARIDNNEEDRELHVQNVLQLKEKRDRDVAAGICPLCGGTLVIRNGRYGQFYGCSNYPKCKFTLNNR